MSKITTVGTTTTTFPDGGRVQFGALKRKIATFFGLDRDSSKEAWIGELVKDVIDDLNRKKLWRFNLIEASDFSSVAGTSSYDLTTIASDIWKVYNLRKSSDVDYTLTTVRQSVFDALFQSQSGITGFPYVRTDFNIYRDGTLDMFPTPDGVYTFTLRYFKLIGKPSGDENTLDMPTPYQNVPAYGALARVAAMVGHHTLGYWEALLSVLAFWTSTRGTLWPLADS
jgi:hypothetical protein